MSVIKMFWMMVASLRYYFKAEDKEAFWEWYWEQIPDSQYPNETLWETWDNFKFYITGQHIIFDVRMWWETRFNRKNFGTLPPVEKMVISVTTINGLFLATSLSHMVV